MGWNHAFIRKGIDWQKDLLALIVTHFQVITLSVISVTFYQPFQYIMGRAGIKDTFLQNWKPANSILEIAKWTRILQSECHQEGVLFKSDLRYNGNYSICNSTFHLMQSDKHAFVSI